MYSWLLLLAVVPLTCALHNVTRSISDSFWTGDCIRCDDYAAYCSQSFLSGCCQTCECYYGKSYLFNQSQYMCVTSPAHELGCKFHFSGHSKRGNPLLSIKFSAAASITQIGIMLLPKVPKTTCKFIHNECVYWNEKKWTSLFTDGRLAKDFFIEDMKNHRRKAVKFRSYQKDESLYEGLLIKMMVSCQNINPSCLMFKFEGTRNYGYISGPTFQPTSSDKPLSSTILPKHEKKTGLNIGITVGIVIVVLLFILSIILFVVVKKRLRKKHREGVMKFTRNKKVGKSGKRLLKVSKDEEAVYQTPDVSKYFGHASDADIDNPGYLIPVDSTKAEEKTADEIIYQDVDALSKKKKDPNYDYPELKLKRKEELSVPLHEYAELGNNRKSNTATTPTADQCSGYTKLAFEKVGDGYQELHPVTQDTNTPSPSSPKYFQLEHSVEDEEDGEEVKI